MIRFYYVIIASFFLILYYVPKMAYYAKHPEKYSETQCYRLAQTVMRHVKRKGRITTKSFGTETLPEEGGYIMYSNHQGRYDALGIISVHEKPCSVVMDAERSQIVLAKQFVDLLEGVRMSKTDIKQQVRASMDVRRGVEQGKRYIYFPEGKYEDNKNTLQEFAAKKFTQ